MKVILKKFPSLVSTQACVKVSPSKGFHVCSDNTGHQTPNTLTYTYTVTQATDVPRRMSICIFCLYISVTCQFALHIIHPLYTF